MYECMEVTRMKVQLHKGTICTTLW